MTSGEAMPVYLDCNATTPIEPRVCEAMLRYLAEEVGNAGSTTHDFGRRAKQAVQNARDQVGAVVGARRHEVLFTSGATESNNLALLGLASHGEQTGKRHIVSTQIEHRAVLEPLNVLARRGFEVTLVPPTAGGWIEPAAISGALRPDTLLVSMMHANNETGVRQPIVEIAELLREHPAYFHVDAAQGFGKDIAPLRDGRIDLISVSGHKIFGPQGIGALIARRREFDLPPLAPLLYGGGQELGLRPGTLPAHLIVGLGLAAEIALAEWSERGSKCRRFRQALMASLAPLNPVINGDPDRSQPHVLNVSLPGVDSERAMEAMQEYVAVSNGSACTSACATASHVLAAMGVSEARSDGAIRFSWCHLTELPDLEGMVRALQRLSPDATGRPPAGQRLH